MNVENESRQEEMNLGLTLIHSDHCIQRRLNYDSSSSGAGANADKRVDMEFVAADPLSELIWSPQNGLSLKCTHCNFVDKKPSILRCVRPSHINFSHHFTAGVSDTDNLNEENFSVAQDAFHTRAGAGHYSEEMNAGQDVDKNNTSCDLEEICTSRPIDAQIAEESEPVRSCLPVLPEEFERDLAQNISLFGTDKGLDIDSGNQIGRAEVVVDSEEEHHPKEREANDTLAVNSVSLSEKENAIETNVTNPLTVHPLQRLESTAENDVRALVDKTTLGSPRNFIAPKHSHEIGTNADDNCPPVSQTLRYKTKGKEKALSDGDVNGRSFKMDDDEDESHESVESCNSRKLLSTGKRRWDFDEKMIEESKRVKMEIQEGPGSTSVIRNNNSSFMNWISNMMKGYSKSDQDDEPSLDLTLAHPNYRQENPGRKLNSECENRGFRSLFQSIYSSKTKGKSEMENKQIDFVVTPLACCSFNDNLGEQLLPASEKFNNSSSGDRLASENSKGNSGDNKNSYKSGTLMGKVETKLTSSMDKPMKAAHNLSHGKNPLGSLWVARFTPKASLPLLNLDDGDQNYATDQTEASVGSHKIEVINVQKSVCKVNPILPSSKLKMSEAMASVFAKRLDALKHIMALDGNESADNRTVSCFFCGKKGHHMQNCSNITDGELQDLMRNVNTYTRGNAQNPAKLKLNVDSATFLHGNPSSETDLKISSKPYGETSCVKPSCKASSFKDYFASSYRENSLKEKRIVPFSNVGMRQISKVQKGIFDAILRLRLSRSDVVKYMNSHTSLALLDGFFLRLRLGKWEEGLRGTGYYVACIIGTQRENSPQNINGSIFVSVGGIKCLVESQYISNHDFLEDELTAWWSSTTKNGGQIPSEEDLRQKMKERKVLGL